MDWIGVQTIHAHKMTTIIAYMFLNDKKNVTESTTLTDRSIDQPIDQTFIHPFIVFSPSSLFLSLFQVYVSTTLVLPFWMQRRSDCDFCQLCDPLPRWLAHPLHLGDESVFVPIVVVRGRGHGGQVRRERERGRVGESETEERIQPHLCLWKTKIMYTSINQTDHSLVRSINTKPKLTVITTKKMRMEKKKKTRSSPESRSSNAVAHEINQPIQPFNVFFFFNFWH